MSNPKPIKCSERSRQKETTQASTKEYATSTWELSFKKLKNGTQALLKESRISQYEEDAGDYIDKSAIPFVERIDGNPSLTTVGSCSGRVHADKSRSGYPFILIAFKDMKTMQKYETKLKRIGVDVERHGRNIVVNELPDGTAYITYDHSGLYSQKPILQVQPKRPSTGLAHAFWESCTKVLEG